MMTWIAEALAGMHGQDGIRQMLQSDDSMQFVRAALTAMATPGTGVDDIRLERAKFKPDRKLTAWYRATITAAGQVPVPRPIVVTWEPRLASDVHNNPADAVETEALERGLAAPFTRLVATIPGRGMTVRVFPYATRFNQLPRVADPACAATILKRVGRERDAGWTVTPIRYRPGQRHVLCYDPVGSSDPLERVYAKLYRSDADAARAEQLAMRLATVLEARNAPIGALRPLGVDTATLLYPAVPGEPLARTLCSLSPDVERVLATLGSTLRSLHDAPADLADELRPHPFQSELESVARAAEHVPVFDAVLGARMKELLRRTHELYPRLEAEPDSFVHGDLKADHLLCDGERITLIDFDTCYLTDPAQDTGKFLADLSWWFVSANAAGLDRAQARFLNAYGVDAAAPRLARARVYEALVLLKITAHRVVLWNPDWRQDTAALLDRAALVLDQAEQRTIARAV